LALGIVEKNTKRNLVSPFEGVFHFYQRGTCSTISHFVLLFHWISNDFKKDCLNWRKITDQAFLLKTYQAIT